MKGFSWHIFRPFLLLAVGFVCVFGAPAVAGAERIDAIQWLSIGNALVEEGVLSREKITVPTNSIYISYKNWPERVRFPDMQVFQYKGTFGDVEAGEPDRWLNAISVPKEIEGNRGVTVGPRFGTPGIPAGTYTLLMAKRAYEQGSPLDTDTWFRSGGSEGDEPPFWDSLTFTYDDSQNPLNLESAIKAVRLGDLPLQEGERHSRSLLGETPRNLYLTTVWPHTVSWRSARGRIYLIEGTFGNIAGGTPVLNENYMHTSRARLHPFPYTKGFDAHLLSEQVGEKTYTLFVTERDRKSFHLLPHQQEIAWFASGGESGQAPDAYSLFTFTLTDEPPCCSSVLFLPGIQASRLYQGGDQLWEPRFLVGNHRTSRLRMDETGRSIEEGVYTEDVIAESNVVGPETPLGRNIYKSFLNTLEDMKQQGEIADWHAQPYDWRKDLRDIVREPIVLREDSTTLVEEIERLANASQTGKVSIVAHSMGGLVGKLAIAELERLGKAHLVDRLIMVGTPQLGTPKSIPALLHGYGQSQGGGLVISPPYARAAAQNMKSAYALLPSEEYMERALDPVIELSVLTHTTPEWKEAYGENINTYTELVRFLADLDSTREHSAFFNTLSPETLSGSHILAARNLHRELALWEPPENLEIVQIAGYGLDTLSGMKYVERDQRHIQPDAWLRDIEPVMTGEGDGTVVSPSALEMEEERWYVDLAEWNDDVLLGNYNHTYFVEVTPVLELIQNSILEEEYFSEYISRDPPLLPENQKTLRFSVHSPIALGAYNESGQFTGKHIFDSGEFEFIEETIPNSTYLDFGEGKYIYLPEGEAYTLTLQGTGEGTFTLAYTELVNGTETGRETYTTLPVTSNTTGTLSVDESGALTSFLIDTDGDGTYERDILAEEDEEEPTPTYETAEEYLSELRALIPTLDIERWWRGVFLHRLVFVEHFLNKDRPYQASILVRSILYMLDGYNGEHIPREPTAELRVILNSFYAHLRSKI